jgi:hypothetical protein
MECRDRRRPVPRARPSPLPYGSGRSVCALAGVLLLATGLGSCKQALQRTDLPSFFETCLSNVLLRSYVLDAGSGALTRVPSGKPITCSIVVINSKLFDVAYRLSWDVSDSLFTSTPPASPSPSAPTKLSFGFTLDSSSAEHKTIHFSLGKYVAAIDKTFDTDTFSIVCDSPPDPAKRVAAMMDSGQKSGLAVLLPTGISDDDLAALKIAWQQEGSSSSETGTYAIASLSTPPASNPFTSAYDCYFQSQDCKAGYSYSYSVVVVDAAGQESGAMTASSTANLFYLSYDGNGSTSGTAPASLAYRYHAAATVASPGNLAKTDYSFREWNTAKDGSGTGYAPGDSLVIQAGDTTLYAQWYTDTLTIGFSFADQPQALVFSPSSVAIQQGQPMTISCANPSLESGGTGWAWYLDGNLQSGQSGSSFQWTPSAAQVGQHVISCAVSFLGIAYSGSLRATVTQ